jgi:hypothetical protein
MYLIQLSFTKGWKTKIENRVNYWKGGFGTIKTSDLKVIKIPLPRFIFNKDSYKL